jgi:hypothetical protein
MTPSSLLFSALLPQLAGLAALCLLRKHIAIAAFLVPLISAAVFVVPTWHDFSLAAERIESETGDAPCGAFGAMVLFVTFGGGGLHLLASLGEVVLFACFRGSRRSQPESASLA